MESDLHLKFHARLKDFNLTAGCDSKAIGYAKFYSRSHDAVIRVCDAGLPNPRSARAMQDGVRLALLHFLQQLTDFQCGCRNDLDTAPFRFR
jgi:hypothetical protein